MKNSPLSAFVLLGAATLIGGVAWYAMDDDRIPADAPAEMTGAESEANGPRVMNLTPFESRKKGRLEAARREIEEYKKIGKILPNGAIKVPDGDGTPMYVHPELVEGVGRYGEPLYAMAKYKRRAAVPLRDDAPTIKAESGQPKLGSFGKNNKKSVLTFGEEPESGARGPTDAGGGAGDDEAGGGNGDGKPGSGTPKDG